MLLNIFIWFSVDLGGGGSSFVNLYFFFFVKFHVMQVILVVALDSSLCTII